MRNEERIIELLQAKYPEATVRVQDVQKTNVILRGVTIMEKGTNIAPSIYIDNMVGTEDEIAKQIIDIYESNKKTTQFDIEGLKENAKDRVIPQLINTEMNKAKLETVPHTSFLNMSLVYKIKVQELSGIDGIATTQITNQNMELFGLKDSDLFELAKANLGEPVICSIMEKLMGVVGKEILEQEGLTDISGAIPMYFVSNKEGINGASVIAFPEVSEKLGNMLGDYIMLPSSIHEVLIVPITDDIDEKYMVDMVKSVNATEVSPDEILSNNAYKYIADTKTWEIIE